MEKGRRGSKKSIYGSRVENKTQWEKILLSSLCSERIRRLQVQILLIITPKLPKLPARCSSVEALFVLVPWRVRELMSILASNKTHRWRRGDCKLSQKIPSCRLALKIQTSIQSGMLWLNQANSRWKIREMHWSALYVSFTVRCCVRDRTTRHLSQSSLPQELLRLNLLLPTKSFKSSLQSLRLKGFAIEKLSECFHDVDCKQFFSSFSGALCLKNNSAWAELFLCKLKTSQKKENRKKSSQNPYQRRTTQKTHSKVAAGRGGKKARSPEWIQFNVKREDGDRSERRRKKQKAH